MDRILTYNGKVLRVAGGIIVKRSPFTVSDFADIGEVYADLMPGDKVAFIIRHSERYDEPPRNLTDAGIQYALDTGAKFADGIAETQSDIALYSSTIQRCIDTASYIALGTGLAGNAPTVTTESYISSCPYEITAPAQGWEDYSLDAYDEPCLNGGVFADKAEVTSTILNFVKARMNKKLNILVTHDQLLEMFVVTMCNKQIALRFWSGAVNDGITERRWITYLAGMAVILRANGSYEYYPVRSLDRGFQRGYENIYTPG